MSIIVGDDTRLVVSGLTGREGSFHGLRNREYGTDLVAGVTPKKGGQDVEGVPIFDTVKEAVDEAGANTSMVFVPARFAAASINEAIDAGIGTVIAITEGIPVHDMLPTYWKAKQAGVRLIGPNCPGALSPGKANVGIIPAQFFSAGSIGVVSKSGTLTYQIGNELKQAGLGNSSIVGIGGDPIVGSDFIDILELFENDPETELIVLVGEIGGDAEERAADYIAEHVTKPVVAYIAGFTAPPGKQMGHAGAIISGSSGTAAGEAEGLRGEGRPGRAQPQRGSPDRGLDHRLLRAAVGAYTRPPMTPPMISFARGAPSADLLPVEAVRAAAGTALDEDSTRALSYGTGIGHPGLCEWIGERHGGVDPGRVMVTNGSLEAGWMLFSTLLAPGDEVVVEQPSYDRTLLMLEKLGVDRIGVPLEADGIDVDGIEQALADGHRPKLVHIIPNFHNPAGCTLSEAKRRRLVELAAEHGFWIFEDDPYREVHFGGQAAADDAGARRGHRRQGGPRLLVLEDGQPRRPGWIPGRPRRRDQGPGQGRGGDLHLTEHARRVDRLRALPLRRPRREHRGRQPGAGHPTRRRRRAARRADPGGEVRRPRGRLLPLARSRRGHRHPRDARPRQGGGRRLRRRPRLHARRRREQPPPLLRQRPPGRRARGNRPPRTGPGRE